MDSKHSPIIKRGDDLLLRIYLQPKASRDHIVGIHGDEIKIAITAPPIDGKANAHLIKYLSKQFKVAKSQILVEKGALNRHKLIKVCLPNQIPKNLEHLICEK